MKPPPFVYHRPGTLDEALDLLGEHGDEAKVLAGGQSLLPLLSLRLAHPAHLVDINRIDGKLSQIAQQENGAGLNIGALVRLLEHYRGCNAICDAQGQAEGAAHRGGHARGRH